MSPPVCENKRLAQLLIAALCASGLLVLAATSWETLSISTGFIVLTLLAAAFGPSFWLSVQALNNGGRAHSLLIAGVAIAAALLYVAGPSKDALGLVFVCMLVPGLGAWSSGIYALARRKKRRDDRWASDDGR